MKIKSIFPPQSFSFYPRPVKGVLIWSAFNGTYVRKKHGEIGSRAKSVGRL